MKFSILTLFPEMFNSLNESILKKAQNNNKIEIELVNIRDFSTNKHKKVDSPPTGGGPGMILRPDVVIPAIEFVEEKHRKQIQEEKIETNIKKIYLSPKGKVFNQQKAKELSKEKHIMLLCGHYEGVDQRILDNFIADEISIGDYILTGGEIPAMVIIDSVSRLIDKVISDESIEIESFENNLLEYPQYTKPNVYRKLKTPKILLSGNHKEIEKFNKYESLKITKKNRPDLLKIKNLSDEEKTLLEKIEKDIKNKSEN